MAGDAVPLCSCASAHGRPPRAERGRRLEEAARNVASPSAARRCFTPPERGSLAGKRARRWPRRCQPRPRSTAASTANATCRRSLGEIDQALRSPGSRAIESPARALTLGEEAAEVAHDRPILDDDRDLAAEVEAERRHRHAAENGFRIVDEKQLAVRPQRADRAAGRRPRTSMPACATLAQQRRPDRDRRTCDRGSRCSSVRRRSARACAAARPRVR